MAIVEIGSNQKKLENMILIKNNIMWKKLKKWSNYLMRKDNLSAR